jgi:uncharacterized RDD family membrane protein YckC
VSDLPPPPPPPPPGSQPPPPPGGGYGYGPQPQKAGPWIRLLARIIDGFVLFIPALIVSAIVGGGGANRFETGGSAFVATAISTIIGFAYYVWLESSRGQTLGKMALSLKAHGPDGALPTTEQAMKRNAWYLLGIIPVLGSLAQLVIVIAIAVTISNDPQGRGLHDNFAGGTVVTKG